MPDKKQVLEVCQRKDGDQRQDQPHNYVEGGDMMPQQRQRVGHLGKRHWERLKDLTVEKPSFLPVLAWPYIELYTGLLTLSHLRTQNADVRTLIIMTRYTLSRALILKLDSSCREVTIKIHSHLTQPDLI
jgi:hypothetical protein